MNVSYDGLRGRHHPSLANIKTAIDVKKLRPHLKLLTCDYFTLQSKYDHSKKGSPLCKACDKENETIPHIVATCEAYEEFRKRLLDQISEVYPALPVLDDPEVKTQFILDPTSLNLAQRINRNDPVVPQIFSFIRDFCFRTHNERMHA